MLAWRQWRIAGGKPPTPALTLPPKDPLCLLQVVDDSTTNKMLLVMDYLEGGPVMTREGLGEMGACS